MGAGRSGKSHLASALTASQAPNLTVVDDVDQYSKGRQRTLFHRFNALVEQPEQALVVFGNQPPRPAEAAARAGQPPGLGHGLCPAAAG